MDAGEILTTAETYTCAYCGGAFAKVVSDGEALAESIAMFGIDEIGSDPASEHLAVVCDDCWQRVMAWRGPHRWQRVDPSRYARGHAGLRWPEGQTRTERWDWLRERRAKTGML